jgi:hypothetical protein
MFIVTKKINGYITLLSILVVGVIGVAVTTSIILLGLSSSNTSFSYQKMHQAKSLANACAEEALQQIRDLSAYVGSSSLTQGQGSCTYTVTNTGGDTRQINTTGTVGTVIRKNTVNISAITPLIIISSWQEI